MELINMPITPYKGNEKYIFVSYSHRNTATVLKIIEHLQNDGYRVWYDEGIDPGTEWDENIANHVEECSCFVAFLSKEYLASSNCKDELNFARELDKPRLLVYLEDVELPGGLRMRLSRLQAIHMYKYTDEDVFFEKLYEFSPLSKCQWVSQVAEHTILNTNVDAELHIGRQHFRGVLIGRGFAGHVYKAHNEDKNIDFVFKKYDLAASLHIPFFTRNDLGRDLQDIKHENLCGISDIIRDAEPSIIMEYIDGETLQQYLQSNELSINDGLRIIKQVLQGLEALHARDIYYGDITPDNIMIANQQVYLCDFSEANYNGSKYDEVTMILHKYRSPEKQPGKIVDFRSDIYEAGMLLDSLTLKMLDDNISYWSDNGDVPLDESQCSSSLDHLVFRIIRKATRYEAGKRYSSVRAMIKDVENALSLA